MRNFLLCLFVIGILASDMAFAQKNNTSTRRAKVSGNTLNFNPDFDESGLDYLIRDRVSSAKNIKNLRTGILLVRLKTRQSTIEAFISRGYRKMAEQVKEKQRKRNLRLMNAFEENFNFCDVYFFYSEDSEKVSNLEWEGIFLNENLEKDVNITPNKEFFLTAELGPLVMEPSVIEDDGGVTHANTMTNESTFVIKDQNFEQLKRPFPFFVKAGQKYIEKKVAKLNRQLHSFHN